MDHPPFNIFSQRLDPEGVLAALRERLPEHEVSLHPDGTWAVAKGEWKRGWLKKSLGIKVEHDPSYYAGPDWQAHLAGMASYLGRFPRSESRPDVFGYLPGLAFALRFSLDPGPVDNDPRRELVFEMARLMEGVIFLPTCLLDCEGRVLLAADGQMDEEAALPAHTPMEPAKAAQPENDGQPELHPPAAGRIEARLILMVNLAWRGFLELDSSPGGEAERQDKVELLRRTPAWQAAEPWEVEALETPAGELDSETTHRLTWQSEGAVVLAWALQLAGLPAYDQQVDIDALLELRDRLLKGSLTPALRDTEEIDRLAFQMLAIHWRLRQFAIEGTAMDFAAYAPRAWCGAMDLSLTTLIGNDLAIGGVPVADASEEARIMADGNMEERRKACHWVLGHEAVYSANDTAT